MNGEQAKTVAEVKAHLDFMVNCIGDLLQIIDSQAAEHAADKSLLKEAQTRFEEAYERTIEQAAEINATRREAEKMRDYLHSDYDSDGDYLPKQFYSWEKEGVKNES